MFSVTPRVNIFPGVHTHNAYCGVIASMYIHVYMYMYTQDTSKNLQKSIIIKTFPFVVCSLPVCCLLLPVHCQFERSTSQVPKLKEVLNDRNTCTMMSHLVWCPCALIRDSAYIHVFKWEMRRKKERNKQGHTNKQGTCILLLRQPRSQALPPSVQ